MRLIFMGTPRYAQIILKALLQDPFFEIVALFSQPDKPVGRNRTITPPETKAYLQDKHPQIPIFQPNTLKNQDAFDAISSLKPDFIVVAAFGQILPKEILNIAPCINLHASILPKYRGASPVHESILNMDSFSGVSAMLMNEGLDTGDVLSFSFLTLSGAEEIVALTEALAKLGGELVIKTLKNYPKIAPLAQIDADATLCKKIKRSNGIVRFNNAKEIFAKYRAFKNWPEIETSSGLKLKKIELMECDMTHIEGEILQITKNSATVGCKKGSIRIFSVQPQSKNEMDMPSYLRGKRLNIGDILV